MTSVLVATTVRRPGASGARSEPSIVQLTVTVIASSPAADDRLLSIEDDAHRTPSDVSSAVAVAAATDPDLARLTIDAARAA